MLRHFQNSLSAGQIAPRPAVVALFEQRPAVAALCPMRPTKRNAKARRGVAVVEMAIMMPVFVLILLGTIEACTMIFLEQTLKIAAHEGARTAVVPQSDATKVQNTMITFLTQRGIKGYTFSISPNSFPLFPYATLIQVDVTAPCDQNCIFPPWFYSGKSLTGSVIMMKEN